MPTIRFAWWNLENFFDTDDDPISSDFEFTSANGWTPAVYASKKANLAAALNALHGGSGPELLGVAEIEKDAIFKELIQQMGNQHLKVVEDLAGTSDLRGIDVSLAYDDRKLDLVFQKSHVVHLRYATRDIFEVKFKVHDTQEEFVVIASHWPSRRQGRYESEPFRIAVAENIAYLVQAHVKLPSDLYEATAPNLRLNPVLAKWNTPVMVVGDFNDEPWDRSVLNHLHASRELDRVTGPTNDFTQAAVQKDTASYRERDVFLYNPGWKFASLANAGSFFMDITKAGESFSNRYQVLDQLVVSRGLLGSAGLRLNVHSVDLFRASIVATGSGRPRPFDKQSLLGTSDHLPLTAVLEY